MNMGRTLALWVGLFLSTCAALCRAQGPCGAAWVPAPASRGELAGHAMVFDEARREFVAFGGIEARTGPAAETWVWNGYEWVRRSRVGPTSRVFHAMAYDPDRRRVVVFGGRTTGGGLLRDVWEWDGVDWTQRVLEGGPSGRQKHAMAYDRARHVLVVYGGAGADGLLSDTWELSSTGWRQAGATGPVAREGHALAVDGDRGVVLFSGRGVNGQLGDFWRFDGVSWSQLGLESGPSAREGAVLVADASAGRVLLMGGEDGSGKRDDLWSWSSASGWSMLSGPMIGGRAWHAGALDPRTGVFMVYGGSRDTDLPAQADTWAWDGAWRCEQAVPTPRDGTRIAYDRVRARTVLFSGLDNEAIDDLYEREGMKWRRVFPSSTRRPAARFLHSMVFDGCTNEVMVMGGNLRSAQVSGDVWLWNGVRWRVAGALPPRAQAALAFHPGTARTMLHGGGPGPQSLGDTWEWNGSSWGLVDKKIFTPVVYATLVYDPVESRMLLFGTLANGGGNVFAWDGSVWKAAAPAPERIRAAAYDPDRDVFVAISNTTGFYRTYEWDRNEWRATADGPGTPFPVMTFDEGRRVIVTAVDAEAAVGDVSEYRVSQEPTVRLDTTPVRVCSDQRRALVASYSARAPYTLQWFKDGVPVANAHHQSISVGMGAGTSGAYALRITSACGDASSESVEVLVCIADTDCDGHTTSGDFFEFLRSFFTGSGEADVDANGFVDSGDFCEYLRSFFSGC